MAAAVYRSADHGEALGGLPTAADNPAYCKEMRLDFQRESGGPFDVSQSHRCLLAQLAEGPKPCHHLWLDATGLSQENLPWQIPLDLTNILGKLDSFTFEFRDGECACNA